LDAEEYWGKCKRIGARSKTIRKRKHDEYDESEETRGRTREEKKRSQARWCILEVGEA
jgi:hypothetical protein